MVASQKYDKFLFDTEFFEVSLSEEQKKKNAEEALAQAEQQAYDRGYQEGHNKALDTARHEFAMHFSRIEEMLGAIDNAKTVLTRVLEAQALSLLKIMLQKLVAHAKEHYSDEILTATIQRALKEAANQTHLVMRINPQTLEYINEMSKADNPLEGKDVTLTADGDVPPADCVLEWETGGIDAKLDMILDEMVQTLDAAQKSGVTPSSDLPVDETDPVADSAETEAEAAAEAQEETQPEAENGEEEIPQDAAAEEPAPEKSEGETPPPPQQPEPEKEAASDPEKA